ncbi:hypothetical protein ACIRVM_42525, partial [Streptomyces chartreusis]
RWPFLYPCTHSDAGTNARIRWEPVHHFSGRNPRTDVDWATLAADLGYADQAHLVRDFTATVGVPPTAYAQGAEPR